MPSTEEQFERNIETIANGDLLYVVMENAYECAGDDVKKFNMLTQSVNSGLRARIDHLLEKVSASGLSNEERNYLWEHRLRYMEALAGMHAGESTPLYDHSMAGITIPASIESNTEEGRELPEDIEIHLST